MEEIARLKKQLEKAVGEGDHDHALDLIRALDRTPVTLDLLGKTKVGLAVGKLRKHDHKTLAAEATKLVGKWKRLVADQHPPQQQSAGKHEPPAAAAAPAASSQQQQEQQHKGAKETEPPVERQQAPQADKEQATHRPSPPTSPDLGRGGMTGRMAKRPPVILSDPPRQRVFEMMVEALNPPANQSLPTGVDDSGVIEIAKAIEADMFNQFQGTNDNYKGKFRQLFNNLKNPKNPELRNAVLRGDISPSRLCSMTSQELASKEQQEERKALEQACLKEVMRGVAKEATTNMFRCNKCKKRECTYFQLQTRSADEPMTTFVTCTNCNNRWKF